MILTTGQCLQLAIAIIGLVLNIAVGLVVGFGLKLKSPDLKLMLVMSILDTYYYIHNIVRISLISLEYLMVDTIDLNPAPLWWCRFDATIDMALYLVCIELVATLSFMRYLNICRKVDIKPTRWYLIGLFSFISNFSFSLIYIYNGYYKWSSTKLVCIVAENPNNNLTFKNYYYFWVSNYLFRSLLSLLIISFTYFSMTKKYFEIISSRDGLFKAQGSYSTERLSHIHDSSQYLHTGVNETYSLKGPNLFKQKLFTIMKLFGAIFAYTICITPDIVLNILSLLPGGLEGFGVDISLSVFSNLLLSCYGIINALFVLLSHDPSKRYIYNQIEYFVKGTKSYNNHQTLIHQ
ncbi:hypothetical protein K502DRAFT_365301 [Neoconidiobolus thromboides FSU 785]|nr:hypothetical protein K502DRAFT_365301 [Neoconidiobolus thromboides FSU 785]